jgi:hypothetical protein
MMYRLACLITCFAAPVFADPPDIVASQVAGSQVSVTLAHPDTGWDHYADGWRIETEDGTVVGTRELLHPHETEQPFTRSLRISDLPAGPLFVRAKCSVDGWSDDRLPLSR